MKQFVCRSNKDYELGNHFSDREKYLVIYVTYRKQDLIKPTNWFLLTCFLEDKLAYKKLSLKN